MEPSCLCSQSPQHSSCPHASVCHLLKIVCHQQVDLAKVQAAIEALKPPDSGPPNPVTKLWPQHMSPEVSRQLAAGSGLAPAQRPVDSKIQATCLKTRFPVFFEQYGYD